MLDVMEKVEEWATARKFPEHATIEGQLRKLQEEVDELVEAYESDNGVEYVDAIGDITVVLTILAMLGNTSLSYCYREAYHQIKDRKGQMLNGAFVKEQDYAKFGIDRD